MQRERECVCGLTGEGDVADVLLDQVVVGGDALVAETDAAGEREAAAGVVRTAPVRMSWEHEKQQLLLGLSLYVT